MALKLITAPANLPLTLAEAKSHLRVVDNDDDLLISALLGAATSYVEEFMGRRLIDQTWELIIDEFPENEIKIPMPPLIEVVSIKYHDAAGDVQTVPTADYTVDNVSEPGWVLPDGSWPATFDGINSVQIQFRAGYLDSSASPPVDNVPPDIKAAILLYLGSLYAHRETAVVGQTTDQMPWGAEQLLRMHRVEISLA